MKLMKKKNITIEDLAGMVKKGFDGVDLRFDKVNEKSAQQTVLILSAVDDKLERMELRIDKKIDKLTNTLDAFLKRLTIQEDEFEMMKLDINRMKGVIKDRLGIDLS